MKEPILRGGAAFVYVLAVATLMSHLSQFPDPAPLFAITGMLSLLTFSAAIMGYLFFWQPAQLFLSGKGREAAGFFFRTLATFGVLMACFAAVAVVLSAA